MKQQISSQDRAMATVISAKLDYFTGMCGLIFGLFFVLSGLGEIWSAHWSAFAFKVSVTFLVIGIVAIALSIAIEQRYDI